MIVPNNVANTDPRKIPAPIFSIFEEIPIEPSYPNPNANTPHPANPTLKPLKAFLKAFRVLYLTFV